MRVWERALCCLNHRHACLISSPFLLPREQWVIADSVRTVGRIISLLGFGRLDGSLSTPLLISRIRCKQLLDAYAVAGERYSHSPGKRSCPYRLVIGLHHSALLAVAVMDGGRLRLCARSARNLFNMERLETEVYMHRFVALTRLWVMDSEFLFGLHCLWSACLSFQSSACINESCVS